MKATHTVIVRSHPSCLDHVPVLGHPEAPGRLRTVLTSLEDAGGRWELEREAALSPEDDTLGVVRWLHDGALVERLRTASQAAPGYVDSTDNPVSSGSFRAAVAAAGIAVQTALDLVNGRLTRAFLAIRPPGHHAERDRAKGFCFFNNIALVAEVIARAWGVPVLIADYDVHHGNGTQHMFYDRGDVGYLSVHRYPFFPGTGAGDETGEGPGLGMTLNVPLAVGARDAVYASAFEAALEELANRIRPAVILLSAGFDGHQSDPVGGMGLTEEGYRRMTRAVVQASETWSEGRLISVLEGGYHPGATATSVRAHLEELAGLEDGVS
ncbi:MAG: histone deacetylase [Acidobacteria bacterium]|nr:histone deacetylase [Acidobacteriota bacterium]